MALLCRVVVAAVITTFGLSSAHAASLSDYLIVGNALNDTASDSSKYELGRISDTSGSMDETSVNGPGVAPTISNTPTYDGNIAITSDDGQIKMSNIEWFADIGADCAGSYNDCTDSGSNFSNTNYDDAAGGSGPRAPSNGDGVNGGLVADMNDLLDELEGVADFVNALDYGLDADLTISTGGDGTITSDTIVNLGAGLNIVNFDIGNAAGTDISVQDESNLIFQGGADAFAIVLVPDASLFKTSNGNLVIGNGGIGTNNVMIASRRTDNAGHFDLSNTMINGVALWDVNSGIDMGDNMNMSLDNVNGCTQLISDDIDIQDVYLSRCAFNASVIPVPGAVWLFGSGLAILGWVRRRA